MASRGISLLILYFILLTNYQELKSKGYSPAYTTNPSTNTLLQLFYLYPDSVKLQKQHPDVLLLDCTYKTNRFNMLLLNICAISGNNRVVQVRLAFLSSEKEADYTQAIQQLRNIIAIHNIKEPVSIVTDRELALINCLESSFSQSIHLLCRWHININTLTKVKKYFPAPIKDLTTGKVKHHPFFKAFLTDWNTLLSSSSESLYNERLEKIETDHPTRAISYYSNTQLLQKKKLIAYQINQHYYFGVTVTSPIEGCYTTLKLYLQQSN